MKILILVATVTVLTACGVLFWYDILVHEAPVSAVQASEVPAPAKITAPLPAGTAATTDLAVQADIGLPVRLKIPKIRVNTLIEKVGLAVDGSMGVPSKPRNVAWYRLGPRPGETGSAVISGHINWLYGATAAFANVPKLKPGDKITVQDDKGMVISFVVRESRKYDASADATDVFVSNDGKAHLNLITCAGVWNKRAKQYTQRLVVFADRETE